MRCLVGMHQIVYALWGRIRVMLLCELCRATGEVRRKTNGTIKRICRMMIGRMRSRKGWQDITGNQGQT